MLLSMLPFGMESCKHLCVNAGTPKFLDSWTQVVMRRLAMVASVEEMDYFWTHLPPHGIIAHRENHGEKTEETSTSQPAQAASNSTAAGGLRDHRICHDRYICHKLDQLTTCDFKDCSPAWLPRGSIPQHIALMNLSLYSSS
jgi:hypothetical protein